MILYATSWSTDLTTVTQVDQLILPTLAIKLKSLGGPLLTAQMLQPGLDDDIQVQPMSKL